MKILDILLLEELVQTNIRDRNYNGLFRGRGWTAANVKANTKNKSIGTGSHASVKLDPNDPHMAKKHNHRIYDNDVPEQADGFNKFINYLIEHDLMDNIHFPKVYNVETITDKRGRRIHSYQMERLVKWDAASREEMEAFVEHNVVGGAQLVETNKGRSDSFFNYEVEALVINAFFEAVASPDNKVFTSESLIEAFAILRKVAKGIGVGIDDLHFDNVMFRRTPTGLVLVIVDPFY